MNPHWKIIPSDSTIVENLARLVPCHLVTATVLANRGFENPESVTSFLHPSLNRLHPPFDIKDMDAAVTRINHALEQHEKIVIFGDYDVDGVTATAILNHFLMEAGADVTAYLPHRVDDGYGLNPAYIDQRAKANNVDLIITVDNGSTSHEAVNQARKVGIDVIIVDHHAITPPYPEAVAIVNPKRPDCDAGLANLAGVGVVFSLIICLRKYLRESGFWKGRVEPNLKSACDLVALGTIADMVPLRDDNRILARTGLDLIRGNKSRPGMAALVKNAGISPQSISSDDIAFRLAPRLNAAGRMDHAEKAFSLLATDNSDTAIRLARQIEDLNNQRRDVQQKLVDRIHADLEKDPILSTGTALVLWDEAWHEGVLGIAAARLMNEYHRPVILISTRNGVGKGSARSTPGFDLYRGLTACHDLLVGYGGHEAAAGITIDANQLPTFRKRFESVVAEVLNKKAYVPSMPIDMEIDLDDISERLMDELELLAPFGNANPVPLFLARDIKVVYWKIVGKTHLSMQLQQRQSSTRQTIRAIQFNINPKVKIPATIDALVFTLSWNHWNQKKTPQMVIKAAPY